VSTTHLQTPPPKSKYTGARTVSVTVSTAHGIERYTRSSHVPAFHKQQMGPVPGSSAIDTLSVESPTVSYVRLQVRVRAEAICGGGRERQGRQETPYERSNTFTMFGHICRPPGGNAAGRNGRKRRKKKKEESKTLRRKRRPPDGCSTGDFYVQELRVAR